MIEVNNRTRTQINEALLHKVASRVLQKEKKANANLSIALVGSKKAEELNKKYRNKDKVANVLSFPEPELGLGEVVLCPQQIRKDAKKYDMIFEKALSWMLIHGILHLLGYDHETGKDATKMEQKENQYLTQL